jgi:hypothetical protein
MLCASGSPRPRCSPRVRTAGALCSAIAGARRNCTAWQCLTCAGYLTCAGHTQEGPRPPARTLHCKDYVTAVALVKPDPSKQFDCDGMPLYFLAVALRDSVQLFKLELSDTEIAAHETPIEIPVDSFVCKMVSTPLGRLFVGCSDGCVYELHYEEEVPPRPCCVCQLVVLLRAHDSLFLRTQGPDFSLPPR